MPGLIGVISIPSDQKDAVICVDKMYREAITAEATETTAPAKESKKMKRASKDVSKESGKHASPECAAPVDDLPESSNSKRSKAAAPAVKKVPAGLAGTDGTFTISATLDDK
jgi:hypothetical protein